MKGLLRLSKSIDNLNERVAKFMLWGVLIAVLICSINAISRKLFSSSAFFQHNSSVMFELQFFLFSCIFLFGAAYTLRHDAHVRIDVLSSRYSERGQVKLDIFGFIFFMLPICCLIFYYSLSFFTQSFHNSEHSGDSGLLLWPFKLLMPVGYFLLILQGLSELIKRFGYMKGLVPFSEFRKANHTPEDEVREYLEATQQTRQSQ
ncbi:TRAP transporter small permease subunit [Hydromonas duriensis]|uniref:TRAP transporter small permease protein n=1 Tax=Hydromonas duriensis TaxID=1527608 RepID=A0A4R6Y9T0_9BURK|nr:TRAP transporter small permease subunit [Hydromonas duriensis]TDR32202.1 TRAP-type mannitol/chloroaromatic compound transport system permease small subunit [Hydromonas duriensis]